MNRHTAIALILAIIFLAVNMFAVYNELYLLWLLPVFLLIIFLAIYSIDIFFLLVLFFVPLSVQLRFLVNEPAVDIFLPTELFLAVILLILVFKLCYGRELNRVLFRHPVSIAILFFLGWTLITALTSTIFLVSIKFMLVRLCFIAGFFYLSVELFKRPGYIKKALTAYMAGMILLVFYNFFNLLNVGLFNQEAAHSTMHPFFNDHTSFGAALAFLLPLAVFYAYESKSGLKKLFYIFCILVFIAGLVFSYSRAAWISVFISLLFSMIFIMRISWRLVFGLAAVSAVILALSWSSILMKLENIDQDSSGNMAEHIHSIANITSDASNVERINRWKSALRMSSERPLFGWGPGTYQFKYAPYQMAAERTHISTNFGDGGNAHSEYLSAFVESGFPAMLLFIIIIVLAYRNGIRVWYSEVDRNIKYMSLALMTGLLTYVIHGALNNFLDTDKIAAPFWMFIAALLVLNNSVNNNLLLEGSDPEIGEKK